MSKRPKAEIVRGTTPTISFPVNLVREAIDDIEITVRQSAFYNGGISVRKLLSDNEVQLTAVDDLRCIASCKMTQEESFKFKAGLAQAQLRALTITGDVAAHEMADIEIKPSLSEEILK